MTAVRDIVVATPDPPSRGVHNPIHDADGAGAAGYAGALVAGVRTYGWASQTIIRALGRNWLSQGWVDFQLRRPLYAGETVQTVVDEDAEGWQVETSAGDGDNERVVLDGRVGLGNAPWLGELCPPEPAPAVETTAPLPRYTLQTVPLKQPLAPLGAYVSGQAARAMVVEDLGIDDVYFLGGDPVPVHPYFLAEWRH